MLAKQEKRYRRHRRVRAKIKGTSKVPRLCIFKSSKHIYTQLIDDEKGKTILSSDDLKLKKTKTKTKTSSSSGKVGLASGKVGLAREVGKVIAEKACKKGIKKVVFDRGGYKYHGRVKALAEGAREGGLKF